MDILNASNSQSALIATVQSVEDSAVDPWSYSLSRYTPAHAKGWSNLRAVNPQQAQAGGSVFFDIPKIGWLTDCCFSCEIGWDVADATPGLDSNRKIGLPSTGWLNLIDSIVIQSASRELYRMTRASLLCAYSDLSYGKRMAIQKAMQMQNDPLMNPEGVASNPALGTKKILIPLLFSAFGKSDLNIPALFSEPVRVVVNFASVFDFVAQLIPVTTVAANGAGNAPEVTFAAGALYWAGGAVNPASNAIPLSLINPTLIMQQVSLPAELTAATLQQNYAAGSLTQLSYNYVEETVRNTQALSAPGDEGESYSHVLTSTNCIHDIYVYCEIPRSSWADADYNDPKVDSRELLAATATPIPLAKVSFTASGQNVVADIDAEYLGLFGRPTQGDGFFNSCGEGGFFKRTRDKNGQFVDTFVKTTGAVGLDTVFSPTSELNEQDGRDVMNSCYVYRICFSESASKMFSGNMVNLRELSQPTITVQLPRVSATSPDRSTEANDYLLTRAGGKQVQMRVVLRTAGLISTDSANGRTVAVLSN